MPIKFVATCLTAEQSHECKSLGIEVQTYAQSYGEITPDCVTDFSIHCFNSYALEALKNLGVKRATLHPELNLAQIRDIKKCISTEAIIYGKIPLMKMKKAFKAAKLTDRTGTDFFLHGDKIYNSVPIFMADKLNEVEKSGVTHGRLIFTDEPPQDIPAIIKAYMYEKGVLKIQHAFTRGKFYSKV
ncbi:MAG: U32 family peptidase [Defluviitaleaceae bacterium]|nr:U32 family peptidase [Defluviitaleaceae bacterium]